MKWILLFVLLLEMGCSSSIPIPIQNRQSNASFIRQTKFVIRWSKPFVLEEVQCADNREPALLHSKLNGNGSTTYVVECKFITDGSVMRLEG